MQQHTSYVPDIELRTQTLHLPMILHCSRVSGDGTRTNFTEEETEAPRLNTLPKVT